MKTTFQQRQENELIRQEMSALDDMTKTKRYKKREQKDLIKKEKTRVQIASGTNIKQNWALPHFTMLLVGKPGSGKSTLIQKLLTDHQLYQGKFDEQYIISPSAGKLNIGIPEQNTQYELDFNWIYDKIYEINKEQLQTVETKLMGQPVDGTVTRNRNKEYGYVTGNGGFEPIVPIPARVLLQGNSLTFMQHYIHVKNQMMTPVPYNLQQLEQQIQFEQSQVNPVNVLRNYNDGFIQNVQQQKSQRSNKSKKNQISELKDKIGLVQKFTDKVQQMFYTHANKKQQLETHKNILFVLDDVVGELESNRFNFALAKLFLNRRHLIANGTISLIVTSQKFTMIPSRLRSNANWLVLFRLNPVDFENVRVDTTDKGKHQWESILDYVYGGGLKDTTENSEIRTITSSQFQNNYDYLSMHVTGNKNRYFKNLTQEFEQ